MTKKLSVRLSFQASFPKLTMLFEARICNMYLLHSYVPLQLSKSLQVPFNPFSDTCLSKTRVKIWDEEPYIGELHAVPTKFRNKLLLLHYLKKAIAQNYEIKLIQRAYLLTWFPLLSIHNEEASTIARSLSSN